MLVSNPDKKEEKTTLIFDGEQMPPRTVFWKYSNQKVAWPGNYKPNWQPGRKIWININNKPISTEA